MGLTGEEVVDPLTVVRAGAVVCMRYSIVLVRGNLESLRSERQKKSPAIVALRTSRPHAPSILLSSSPHPTILCPVRALASISTNKPYFVGICPRPPPFCQKIHFSSASLVQSVRAHAATGLTASHLASQIKAYRHEPFANELVSVHRHTAQRSLDS